MANNSFYEPQDIKTADYTGYSKGFKSTNLLGDIAEGVGDVIKTGVKAANTYIEENIKDESRVSTDKLFGDYGNDAAVKTNAGINQEIPPKEIQQGANQLALLKQASQNGTLKDSSFWAQAELIRRQLITRYPGHADFVDQTISGQLGRKPNVALHQELMSDWEKNATNEDKDHKSLLDAAMRAGIMEPIILEQQGKRMRDEDIRSMVASRNAIKYEQDYTKGQYELKKAKGEATEEDTLSVAKSITSSRLVTALKTPSSVLFNSSQEYTLLIKEINEARKSGKGIDPTVEAKITAVKSQIDEQINQIYNEALLEFGGKVPSDKLKTELGFVKDWALGFTKAVKDGDEAVGGWNAAFLKSVDDYSTWKLMEEHDAIKNARTLKNTIGSEAEIAWEGRNQDKLALLERDIVIDKFLSDEILLEGNPLIESIRELQRLGVKDVNVYSSQLNKVMNAIVTDEMPASTKRNANEAVYGDNNLNFILDGVSTDQQVQVFLKATSPIMIKKSKELYEKGEFTKNDYDKIINWTTRTSIQLLSKEMANLNDLATTSKSFSVSYNYDTRRIKADPVPVQKQKYSPTSIIGKYIAKTSDKLLSGGESLSVDRVNSILRRMEILAESTGDKPEEFIPELLHKAGVDPATIIGGQPKTEPTKMESAVSATESFIGNLVRGFLSVDPEVKKAMEERNITEPDLSGAIIDLFTSKEKSDGGTR